MDPFEPEEQIAPPTVAVVGIQFRATGQVADYDAGLIPLRMGDRVVAQVARGSALGTVVVPPHPVDARIARNLPRAHKRADNRELARADANRRRAATPSASACTASTSAACR
jgi:hypothetical protein